VTVKNLGILKKAEFDVGDLTIICGANNTGKTYATYALYGFLNYWNEGFTPDLFEKRAYTELLTNGSIKIELDDMQLKTNDIISKACKDYSEYLPMVFAAPDKYFANTDFKVFLQDIDYAGIEKTIQAIAPNRKPVFNLFKKRGDNYITINIIATAEEIDEINADWIMHQINRGILQTLFGHVLTSPFIASIERTGAAIFRKELDFSRNRLLDHVSNRDKDMDPFVLIGTFYDKGYALPVREDVDFNRRLEDVVKNESIIAKNNPDILKAFDEILGGEYKATGEGLYYIPAKNNVKLTMGESASSVRSLLNVGMYIRHLAQPGDILMIDEPELNLHPINQRRMARVLAKLVNAGVRVFITTHSDYILKEFNTLIMLFNSGSIVSRVMEKYGYQENELLDANRIKVYLAKKELLNIDETSRRQKHNTFIPAPIDKNGIEIVDFDETINIMNKIQDELYFIEGL
jgi:predicted ATPase